MRRCTTSRTAACAAMGAGLAVALAACGDEGLERIGGDTTGDIPFFDTADGVADADVGPGDATPDTAPPDASDDAAEDVTPDAIPPDTAADTETTEDVEVSEPPDLIPDVTPPSVVDSSPEAGETGVAVPFTVTVTFDEAIAENTIAAQTVKLFDFEDKVVPAELSVSEDRATVTIEPTGDTYHRASPYRVWLAGGIIADLAGNKLVENYEFTFYTEGFEGMEGYRDLAGQYAPTVHADTTPGTAQARVPTVFDADGDWDGTNTKSWIQSDAQTLIPSLYYDVAETCTHYYIRYQLLFPWLASDSSGARHGNGVLGVMVTVEKASGEAPQRPVAVTQYWKQGTNEENRVFVTEESGIVGPLGPGQYGDIEAEYPQAELFPDDRFEVYVSPTYQSCAWIHEAGVGSTCALNEAVKAGMDRLVFAYDGGSPDPLEKGAFSWPSDMADFQVEDEEPVEALAYALIPTLTTLWPRRSDVGPSGVYGGTYDYAAASGRPANGAELPSKFVDSTSYDEVDAHFGRPVWAWGHSPSAGSVFGVQRGWLGVDPAWYTCTRHGSIELDSAVPPCVSAEAEGFSVSYRFNGYAAVDERDDEALCAPDEE